MPNSPPPGAPTLLDQPGNVVAVAGDTYNGFMVPFGYVLVDQDGYVVMLPEGPFYMFPDGGLVDQQGFDQWVAANTDYGYGPGVVRPANPDAYGGANWYANMREQYYEALRGSGYGWYAEYLETGGSASGPVGPAPPPGGFDSGPGAQWTPSGPAAGVVGVTPTGQPIYASQPLDDPPPGQDPFVLAAQYGVPVRLLNITSEGTPATNLGTTYQGQTAPPGMVWWDYGDGVVIPMHAESYAVPGGGVVQGRQNATQWIAATMDYGYGPGVIRPPDPYSRHGELFQQTQAASYYQALRESGEGAYADKLQASHAAGQGGYLGATPEPKTGSGTWTWQNWWTAPPGTQLTLSGKPFVVHSYQGNPTLVGQNNQTYVYDPASNTTVQTGGPGSFQAQGTGLPPVPQTGGGGGTWNWSNWWTAPPGTTWQDGSHSWIVSVVDGVPTLTNADTGATYSYNAQTGQADLTTPAVGGGNAGAVSRTNYRQEALARLPWMPWQLLKVFIDAWIETDNWDLAMHMMRQDPNYDTYFPGNRRSDGSFRLTEEQYMSTVYAYEDVLRDYGIGSGWLRDRIPDLIDYEVSPSEFRQRVAMMEERIIGQSSADRDLAQIYAEFYGLEGFTHRHLLAAAIDPTLRTALLERQISVAEIGGEAAEAGFSIDEYMSRRLFEHGVTINEADEVFNQAADLLPGITRSSGRQTEGAFGLESYLAAGPLDDPAARRRLRRILTGETSTFTEQQAYRMDQNLGALPGLVPR
jgi:hypothetical protein